jgi:hypothetical protein
MEYCVIVLDAYERRARLAPGLIALAPISVTIFTLGLRDYPAITTLSSILVAIGGPLLLATIVGNCGRASERRLYKRWGGAPATILLRTRSTEVSAPQRDLWRSKLTAATGVSLASEAEEAASPQEADDRITTAINQVRHLGHGDGGGVKMVSNENRQYGFERNMFGFRWPGRFISVACLMALGIVWMNARSVEGDIVAGAAVVGLFLLVWIVFPSKTRVKEAGFRYGTQLLNAVGRMPEQGGTA